MFQSGDFESKIENLDLWDYLPNNGSAVFDSVMGVLFSKFKERKDTES